ncbi:Maf family protein [Desulfuribacillus alkaliarsenatis]|uniref:dTTP/UTP pyrophosphatase n=1 Tax=Desulfuribacillus alkaliarsenatis TaxID=766136 RepID=A0A1E5G6G8_9FIRM|nr:Maf family protein [Desulfuribacillus alkaliarsenatis]OEF98344.1 septum formation protein Maf [Desulfuribacillus alkaliarsenatis]
MQSRIILASQSPRRKELLAGLGLSFIVKVSAVDEDQATRDASTLTPAELAQRLSALKAEAVAAHLSEGIVIGADTIVVLGEEILGKPMDANDAEGMLRKLSGKTHLVISGVTVIDAQTKEQKSIYELTEVDFKEITDEEMAAYLVKANYLDKAGSYAVQEHGALFVKGIRGCFFNVVGLPLFKTAELLQVFDVKIL